MFIILNKTIDFCFFVCYYMDVQYIELKGGENNMTSFNYSKLSGKVKEKFGSQTAFAKALNLSERSLSQKLNSKVGWKQAEIVSACYLLGIQDSEISAYFFAEKVQ